MLFCWNNPAMFKGRIASLPHESNPFRYLNQFALNQQFWSFSTAAKTEMALGVTKREFISIQDRCRAVILRHLNHEDQIEELELPCTKNWFITEGLSDDSQEDIDLRQNNRSWCQLVNQAIGVQIPAAMSDKESAITNTTTMYRTCAIISRSLYFFLPNFHFSCGLYYRQFMY